MHFSCLRVDLIHQINITSSEKYFTKKREMSLVHAWLHFVILDGKGTNPFLCGQEPQVFAQCHNLLLLGHDQLQVAGEAEQQTTWLHQYST
jgi:hypothetical protein